MISPLRADLTLLLFALGMRDIPEHEFPDLFETIASRGLDTKTLYVRGEYKGMTSAEMHYHKHVLDRGEWPAGTSYASYIASAAHVVRNPGYVFSSLFKKRHWQVAFVTHSNRVLTDYKLPFVMVEYRIGYGFWSTAHQPDDLTIEQIVVSEKRSNVRWLLR